MNDAAALHPLVVSAADDLALADKHGADRNAALAETDPGFLKRNVQKLVDPGTLGPGSSLALKNCRARQVAVSLRHGRERDGSG